MDNIAYNHRKRKADSNDDPQLPSPPSDSTVNTDSLRVDTSAVSNPSNNAPRQSWLSTSSSNTIWPSSPQVSSPISFQSFPPKSPKRPRVEKSINNNPSLPSCSRRFPKRPFPKSAPSRPPPTVRHGNDIEDIGIVSNAHPGPSSGSLLHLRGPLSTKSSDASVQSTPPQFIIDTNSIHIPSLQPLINRQTLKELDLEAILRNPQLRHDLLFDPGLQFRPTSSRRKRDISERYWAAVTQEVETGCTCVSFDLRGKPQETVCACSHVPSPPPNTVIVISSSLKLLTLRMPSRIRNLLSEFLEVLLLVIQPLSSISGMYVNPNTFKSQMQEHSAQAAHIRSVFDPVLIEQELHHSLFDPSGLFTSIGATLKGHCAPMRDRAVEMMVEAAQTCAPGGSGTKSDAVRALRMCMEILELMKLDIANHQLQTLRPFLIRTSGQFELKTFKNRKGNDCSLNITRQWLRTAHSSMLSRSKPISHPRYPCQALEYKKLFRNQQTYLAVLKGFVDLVFHPPVPVPASSSSSSEPVTPSSPTSPSAIFPLAGYPETSYLDSARLLVLSSDAAEATVLYMFLLLYRQLVFSECSSLSLPHDARKIDQQQLISLKNEIRDIGSTRLGYCFSPHKLGLDADDAAGSKSDRREAERWRNTKQDIVLQLALRAKHNPGGSAETLHPNSTACQVPDEKMIGVAQRWTDANIQPGSALSTMLRDRLRDVVLGAVISLAYPGSDSAASSSWSSSGKLSAIDFFSFHHADPSIEIPVGAATGMEPLTEEIRLLAEKIARLASIHLNAYLPLYEQSGFWES